MSNLELLGKIANLMVMAGVISNMLSLGMSLTVRQVIEPLRNVRLTVKALIANFVIVPIAAMVLARVLRLEQGIVLGLFLLATAAGSPFVTKASQMCKGDMASTVALMVGLQVVTIFYMPVALPLMLPGVEVSPWSIASGLIVMMMIPLAIGFFVKHRFDKLARLCAAPLDRFSSVAIVIALMLLIGIHMKSIFGTWGERVMLTGLLFPWAALGSGYLLGGPRQGDRSVLGLETGLRGNSAALVVGLGNFPGEEKLLLIVMACLAMSVVTMLPFSATFLRRRNLAAQPQ
jgi:BASS family bile acid:Na+ symporter